MTEAQLPSLSSTFWAAPRPAQQPRFEKILRATIDIAREGGYNAVQIRSVSEVSGVAMGTIYAYFQSRDNLVYRAMLAWNASLAEEITHQGGPQSFPDLESSVATLIERFAQEPLLLSTYIRSTLSKDPAVVKHRQELDWGWWTVFHPWVSELDPVTAAIVPRLLTDIVYACEVRWAFGQIELEEIVPQLQAAIRLLGRALSRPGD